MAVIGDCIVVDKNEKQVFDSGLSELHTAKIDNYFSDSGLKKEVISNWSVPGPATRLPKKSYWHYCVQDLTP